MRSPPGGDIKSDIKYGIRIWGVRDMRIHVASGRNESRRALLIAIEMSRVTHERGVFSGVWEDIYMRMVGRGR